MVNFIESALNAPNNQVEDSLIAGVIETVDADLRKIMKEGNLSPKPLMVCSGGTSSRCGSDGLLTLDLRRKYQNIEYIPSKKEVYIEGGVRMQDLIDSLKDKDRSFPIGLSGITGVGYLLTGGISPLSRKYGLGVDHILEIEGVWGNGKSFNLQKPTASSSQSEKLKWKGLCGAAQFLAIVTKLRLKTTPISPLYIWEASISPNQLLHTMQVAEDWPKNASLHWVWGDYIKAFAVIEIDKDLKEEVIDKFLETLPNSRESKLTKIKGLYDLLPMQLPINREIKNIRKYSEVVSLVGSSWKKTSNILIDSLERIMEKRPDANCHLAAQQLGGAIMEGVGETSSFIHRKAMWKPWITGAWDPALQKNKHQSLQWVEEVWNQLEPICKGVHLAQMHNHLPWHSKETQYAFKDWLPELQRLKSSFDPEGILPPL